MVAGTGCPGDPCLVGPVGRRHRPTSKVGGIHTVLSCTGNLMNVSCRIPTVVNVCECGCGLTSLCAMGAERWCRRRAWRSRDLSRAGEMQAEGIRPSFNEANCTPSIESTYPSTTIMLAFQFLNIYLCVLCCRHRGGAGEHRRKRRFQRNTNTTCARFPAQLHPGAASKLTIINGAGPHLTCPARFRA